MILSKNKPLVYVHADALAHEAPCELEGLVPEPTFDDNAMDPSLFEKLEAALWQPQREQDEADVAAVVADADEVLVPVAGVEFDAS